MIIWYKRVPTQAYSHRTYEALFCPYRLMLKTANNIAQNHCTDRIQSSLCSFGYFKYRSSQIRQSRSSHSVGRCSELLAQTLSQIRQTCVSQVRRSRSFTPYFSYWELKDRLSQVRRNQLDVTSLHNIGEAIDKSIASLPYTMIQHDAITSHHLGRTFSTRSKGSDFSLS